MINMDFFNEVKTTDELIMEQWEKLMLPPSNSYNDDEKLRIVKSFQASFEEMKRLGEFNRDNPFGLMIYPIIQRVIYKEKWSGYVTYNVVKICCRIKFSDAIGCLIKSPISNEVLTFLNEMDIALAQHFGNANFTIEDVLKTDYGNILKDNIPYSFDAEAEMCAFIAKVIAFRLENDSVLHLNQK